MGLGKSEEYSVQNRNLVGQIMASALSSSLGVAVMVSRACDGLSAPRMQEMVAVPQPVWTAG